MAGSWWCPTCKEAVVGQNVTYNERHDTCGQAVEWVEELPSLLSVMENMKDEQQMMLVTFDNFRKTCTRLEAERDSQQRISLAYLDLISRMQSFMEEHESLFKEASQDWYSTLYDDARRVLTVKPEAQTAREDT